MGKGRSPWQDGRRAWERLSGWHQDAPSAVPGHADDVGHVGDARDGDKALSALTDVGSVRRLLDQAELVAVRTARRHRKSWAEIATHLGVSRQSAWERWRDLDDVTTEGPDEQARERRQSPESGAKVPTGSPVKLWVDRGGGSGVREPRNPKPKPRAGREMLYEPSDEALG